jgi:GWxTD domain-containing protein
MTDALGWTLLHSLWEGALIALLLVIALSVIRSARARYTIACLALAGVLVAFCCTFARMMTNQPTPYSSTVRPGSHVAYGPAQQVPRASARWFATDVIPWLTPFWFAGVIGFHLHLLASWLAGRRLRQRGVCCAPDAWQQRLSQLRQRIHLSTPVALLESSLANVPVVIGHLRPVILVPAGLLAGMPAEQMEAILLHELAHIRRLDYLVNLLQTLVEGFLFYHPAVWWISNVIRTERENCCDDLVVAISGEPREYAAALAALEQTRWAAADAVAANGGNLMKRIRRLLYPMESPRTVLTPVLSAVILTITAALALMAWQAQPQENPIPRMYRAWLDEDVVYIIEPRERAAFLALTTDDERNKFIEQFWLRRDPTPDTVENEFKQEHYRRIGYANEHFASQLPGWKTDRGRIYIVYGPPDEIESHPKGDKVRSYPFEQWRYHHIANVGDNIIIDFADADRSGEYRMTKDPN